MAGNNNRFQAIPEFVLKSGISTGAYALYGALADKVNRDRVGFVRTKELAAVIGKSESTAKVYMKELKDAGFVTSQFQWTNDAEDPKDRKWSTVRIAGWRQTMNIYKLTTEPPTKGGEGSASNRGEGSAHQRGEGLASRPRSYNPKTPTHNDAAGLEVDLDGVAEEAPQHRTAPPWEDGPAPDWSDSENPLVQHFTTAPPASMNVVLVSSRDDAEARPDPTLADGVVLRNSNNRWKPTDAAMATARDVVHITDIPLHLARYVVTKAEKRQTPTSAEWLRWIFEDEKRAKAEQVKEMREVRTNRRWDAVAE